LISTAVLLLATLGLSGEATSASANLLENPGFEAGETVPEGWRTFPRRTRGVAYALDDAKCHSGRRSARVEGRGQGFGLVPTGVISGTVTSGGKPLEGARVHIWGDPWGKTCEAYTDSGGRYRLADVPVTFPRYVVMAAKGGYRTRPSGDVEVKQDGNTTVDFQLQPGSDPDDLRVKFGTR